VIFLLLGIDSFIASFALRGVLTPRSGRIQLALIFGISDSVATGLGTFAGPQLASWAGRAGPILVAAYVIYLLVAVAWARVTPVRGAPYVLAVLASLDNLAYGAAHAASGLGIVTSALLLGLLSALCAFVGLALADAAGGRAGARVGRFAIASLALLAVVSFLA
jgi:putative Mn2+ efflux pump MntP